MDIIFAKTRWHYDSYTDFWKLVELSGFPIVYIDEVDPYKDGVTYIVSPYNGEWYEFMTRYDINDVKSELIHWNLERPGGSGSVEKYKYDNSCLIDNGYFHSIIVSDKNLAHETGFHYVPLGSHPGLGEPVPWDQYKAYDLIHLSCYSNHRATLFAHPWEPRREIAGLNIAPNAWGMERHKLLQNTKAMLGVHQDGLPYCEPLRLALAAAYGLIMIWEECDAFPYLTMQFSLGSLSTSRSTVRELELMKKYIRFDYEYYVEKFLIHREVIMEHNTFRKCLESHI